MKMIYRARLILPLFFWGFSYEVLAKNNQDSMNQENALSSDDSGQNQANGAGNQSNSNFNSQNNSNIVDNPNTNAQSLGLENGAETNAGTNALGPVENKVENLSFGENPKFIDEGELPVNSPKLSDLPEANAAGSNPKINQAGANNGAQQSTSVNGTNPVPSNAVPVNGAAEPMNPSASVAGMEPLEPLVTNDFTGAPPFPGAIKAFAEGEAPDFYKVEPGDTLIDVCDQLLDQPGYWPKLWSFNAEIKNPHYIWPGMNLKFYSGDEANPPYLQISNAGSMVPTNTSGLSMASLVDSPFQIAPLPLKKTEPGFEIDPDSVIDVLDVTTDSSDID